TWNARSFHTTSAEIVGKMPEEYTTPHQAQLIRAENRQLLESGQEKMEFDYTGERNGITHYWRIIKFLIPQESGLPLIGGITINQTQEKQTEIALQTLNEQLEQRVTERTAELERAKDRIEAIFNHSGDGILLLDVNRGIQQANYAFDSLFQMSRGDYFGQRLRTYFHPDHEDSIGLAFEQVAATHETQQIEARARRQDGSYFDVEISIAPINRSHKAITNLVCIIRDISERKQAEEALRHSEQRLKMTIDGTRAGTWEWFVQTGETIFNERWADIIGYTLEELAPISIETWSRLAHPDDLGVSGQLLEKHFSGETDSYDCEARMKHKDGHWVWVWDRGQVLEWTPDGKPLRMLGTHVDITDRKQTEIALRQSEAQLRKSQNMLELVLNTIPVRVFWKD
ncbi:MAG: PAS domain S-box protein, partial [Anaerolineae bacterium]|nr:PAS domain S-box protein [Anaerolineae bacterium]